MHIDNKALKASIDGRVNALKMNYSAVYTLDDWNSEKASVLTVNSVVLGLYLFIGVIGNTMVIYIYNFRMKGSRDDRYFIPHLAVMDLCACVVGAGYAMALNILPLKFNGNELCKALWFLTQSTTMCAAFMLVVIAIQRYLKVVRPFKKQMTIQVKHFSVVATVFLSLFLSLPCLLFYGDVTIDNHAANLTGHRCGANPSIRPDRSVFVQRHFVRAGRHRSVGDLWSLHHGGSYYLQKNTNSDGDIAPPPAPSSAASATRWTGIRPQKAEVSRPDRKQ